MTSVSTGGVRASRFVVWVVACVAGLVAPAKSHAQTFTWNQSATGGSWQTATNWLPNSGTPGAISNIAIFGNVLTGANSVSLSGNVTIGELRFDNVNTNSASAAYTIGTSSQSITFDNGASASFLNVAGSTLANQTVATNVVIGGTQPLTITNNGAAGITTLTLSGAISATTSGNALIVDGWSNTAISGLIGSSVGTLTKNGSGVLDLTGRTAANTYTGGTVINGGTIKITNLDNSNNFISQIGTGTVTLNGGALHVAADTFVDNNFTLGANGGKIISTAGDAGSNPTFRGVISGSGGLTLDGGLWMSFNRNNTYTGPTVINNVGVFLQGGDGINEGRLSGTSSITINGYVGGQIGILTLNNNFLTATSDRVNNSAPITLNGGILSYVAGLLTNTNETFGSLTVKGFGSVFGNQVPGGFATGAMTFGALSRDGSDPFTTLYVGGPINGGSGPGTTVQITFSSGLSNSTGTGTAVHVIPWIGGDIGSGGAATALANTLFIYTSTGLRALDPNGGSFEQVLSGGDWNGGGSASNNSITNNPAPVTGTITILSLVQNTATSSSTITGTGTLVISDGAIANGKRLNFNGPTLSFLAKTGFLYLGNEFSIRGNSSITGTGGLVVTSNADDSRNTLFLTNTTNANTFTGGLYLNGSARVAFDTSDSQLGGANEKISFRGGTLRFLGNSSVALSNRPLEMFAAGGGMISLEDAAGILTVPGVISGAEQMTVVGPGTLVLTNTANTYAGGTTIGDSTVRIAAPGSLGTGDITLGVNILGTTFSGGTLRFDGAGTVTANVKHDFSSTLNTNGNNVTISGIVSGNGSLLTKAGAGTLTLSGANTYTGNTTITGGTLLVTNTAASGTGLGLVTAKTGATLGGTGIIGGSVSVENGGTLAVGDAGGLGKLTVRGNTTLVSGANFKTTLTGTSDGTYGQLIVKSGGSINLGSATFQPTLGYVPSGTDKLFLINNQNASGGLSGQFNGLAEGGLITFADGTTAQISYQGDFDTLTIGTGNDLVVYNFIPVPEPASVLAVAALALGALAWGTRRKFASVVVR